ncbi:MAG: acyl-protein synthetase [Lachnospiraceae bacterium]|nr:acyl-protein synthetase [Lachnospiraceae bacterium]
MSAANKLFTWKKPYELKKTDTLFLQAMQENVRHHYENSPDYARILDEKGFHPDDLREYDDLRKIPFIPTLYFKRHTMFSVPEKRLLIKATSSGTSGRRSLIGFNGSSLYRGLRMVLSLCKYHRLISLKPVHYIILGYEPARSNPSAITKTTFGQTLFAPALSRDYALKYTKEGYKLDLEDLKQKLIRFSQSKYPVRMTGFPAYTYFLLKQMKEEGICVKLPKGSLMSLGGGWKQFYAEKITKQDFYELAEEVLGIDDQYTVEFFSAVEHPVLYVDCRCHHFHVPVYSRIIIRDVDSLEPVPAGQVGLINLLTPMVDSVPLASVMTDDLGILHDEKCPCGVDSPWLEILGRVGIKDIVTCAAGAQEMLSAKER